LPPRLRLHQYRRQLPLRPNLTTDAQSSPCPSQHPESSPPTAARLDSRHDRWRQLCFGSRCRRTRRRSPKSQLISGYGGRTCVMSLLLDMASSSIEMTNSAADAPADEDAGTEGESQPRLDSGCGAMPQNRSGSCSWLGSNPDPDADPDNRQRYDDHQHVNRQPCGYALRRLGHSVCLCGPRYVPDGRNWL